VDASGPEDEGAVPPAGDHDGPFSDLPPEWASLVVPDDASALDAEAAEVRAELARERRRARWRTLGRFGGWPEYGISAPLIGLMLLVVASFAGLLVVVLPGGAPLAPAAPLAHPPVTPGRNGGLLPDVRLRDSDGQLFTVRDLRPGVVLLVGDRCDCASLVQEYTSATAEARVRLLVVGDTVVPRLPGQLARGRVLAATDPGHLLAAALHPAASGPPEAVLVASDGRIDRVIPEARNVVDLRGHLSALT
jgi:hypothetical protein